MIFIDELSELQTQGLRRRLRTVRSPADRTVELDGQRVLNFSSNNYLGLANHPRLCAAARDGLEVAGLGSSASRLIVGNHELHELLEQDLAAFHERPAARLFNSGLQRERRFAPGPGSGWRYDLLRSVEPREHHRWLPPQSRSSACISTQRYGGASCTHGRTARTSSIRRDRHGLFHAW